MPIKTTSCHHFPVEFFRNFKLIDCCEEKFPPFMFWPWKSLFLPFMKGFLFLFSSIKHQEKCEKSFKGRKIFIEIVFSFFISFRWFMCMQFIVLVHSKGLKADGTQHFLNSSWPFCPFVLALYHIFPYAQLLLKIWCEKKKTRKGEKSSKFINFIPLDIPASKHVTFSIMTSFIIGWLKLWGCSNAYKSSCHFDDKFAWKLPKDGKKHHTDWFIALVNWEKFSVVVGIKIAWNW